MSGFLPKSGRFLRAKGHFSDDLPQRLFYIRVDIFKRFVCGVPFCFHVNFKIMKELGLLGRLIGAFIVLGVDTVITKGGFSSRNPSCLFNGEFSFRVRIKGDELRGRALAAETPGHLISGLAHSPLGHISEMGLLYLYAYDLLECAGVPEFGVI